MAANKSFLFKKKKDGVTTVQKHKHLHLDCASKTKTAEAN